MGLCLLSSVDTPTPLQPEIDLALLLRAQAGDAAAFGDLMRSHHAYTYRLVYAIVRHEQDARDICQEVWLTVWRQLGSFRSDARFTTWLHPIAVRRALDHLRKRRRWYDRFLPFAAGDATIESVPEPAGDDGRQQTEGSERSARFQRLIDALPAKQRTILALREVQGLSYDEIAHATGIPAGTVMSRLYHARRILAQKLKDNP